MSESKAMILGCAGTELSPDEAAFFGDERPWGFILFARNVEGSQQLCNLTAAMRKAVERPDAPVFIDQEGGRVQRLRPPLVSSYPPAAALGALYRRDPAAGLDAARLMSRLHAFDLSRIGVTADCLPVLDVPVEGSSNVIGDRAYGSDPQMVAALGRAAAEGLMSGGLLPVIKHMPGHGRAVADSHHDLPRVEASLDVLRMHDFMPFKALADMPMAMTAHIVFEAVDRERPATVSPKVIGEIIRGEIGFDGLLMSDDVSMKALSGDFSSRAAAILAAGCDLVLHCNGVMEEMREVARGAGELKGRALARANAALTRLSPPDETDEAEARTAFARYFEQAA